MVELKEVLKDCEEVTYPDRTKLLITIRIDAYGGIWKFKINRGKTSILSEKKPLIHGWTYNRHLIFAIVKALKVLEDRFIGEKIEIITRLKFIEEGVNNLSQWESRNWRKLKNVDLWKKI